MSRLSYYVPHPTCQIPNLGAMYEELFGRRSTGRFVEVGAYDGVQWSNTSFLATVGWKGIYIEPVQEFAAACALHHASNNVHVFPVACGREEDRAVTLHVGGSLSTVSERYIDVYNKLPWAQGNHQGVTRRVPACSLSTILESAEWEIGFDLLVVDVEGGEQAVFDGFDLLKWQPQVMIVELHQGNPDFDAFPDVKEANDLLRREILASGYTEFYVDQINTIFRRKEL
jgi:FkbM family methyltransferase